MEFWATSNFSNWEASTTFLDLTTRKCPFCASCLLQKIEIQYFSVEIFCWVCRWKGPVPIYTTRAEQASEPHHYLDSFLLNMKWFCGQPVQSGSQLNRENLPLHFLFLLIRSLQVLCVLFLWEEGGRTWKGGIISQGSAKSFKGNA